MCSGMRSLHNFEMVSCMSLVRYWLLLMMGVIISRMILLQCVVTEFRWLMIGREMGISSFAPFVYV